MLYVEAGEVEESELSHEGNEARQFYRELPRPVRVGIEATGSMQWFLELMEELQIECLVGHWSQDPGPGTPQAKRTIVGMHAYRCAAGRQAFPTIWTAQFRVAAPTSLNKAHTRPELRRRVTAALSPLQRRMPILFSSWPQISDPSRPRRRRAAGSLCHSFFQPFE
jgi:hypothetical protein